LDNKDLELLRKNLINGRNDALKQIYLDNQAYCQKMVSSRNFTNESVFEDVYTEAILVFRKNIISGKIKELTSVKNYLVSTCLNMAKESFAKKARKRSHEERVKSVLYEEFDTLSEVSEYKEEMIVYCKKALEQLNERCQTILTAFYVHKLSMKEIAIEMELSSSDVSKTLKMRCYKKWISKIKFLMS